ncbi:MAG: dockerin type I repeat-containing protein [Clostridia bacterium]|nr:dockerin type I repeat-containing protein [Clostridia bacterium]
MKKRISLLLAVLMLALAFPMSALATAPEGQAIKFAGDGVYMLFNNVSMASTNGKISFDLSMEEEGGDSPVLNVNGEFTITPTGITMGGTTRAISWGTVEAKHFRHFDINYSGGSVIFSLDGTEVATFSGSYSKNFIYFIGFPGLMYLDNLVIESAGAVMMDLDFDDEGTYMRYKSSDSSAARGTIPTGSYYDYSPVYVPDNVEYIFDSAANAAKLKVVAGVEKYRGDVNGDDKINNRDLTMIKRIVVGDSPDGAIEELADVNGDGSFTTKDAAALKKLISGVNQPVKVVLSTGGSGSAAYDADMNAAVLTASEATLDGIDATLTMSAITASDYPYAVVTYLTPNAPNAGKVNSAAANKSAFGAWGNLKQYNLTTDGKFHSEIVDLSDISTWNGDAATLRFFVAANAGDKLYVDSIIFCGNLSRANTAKSAREAAKASYTITDAPVVVPGAAIGALDADGNYQIVFDTKTKVTSKVSPLNNTSISFDDDAIKAKATGTGDPNYEIDLSDEGISASTYKYIAYVFKNPNSNASGKQANLYYVVDGITTYTAGYQSDLFGGDKSSKYCLAIVDLSAKSNWTGSLKSLRIDYFTDTTVGDLSYLDSITFCRTSALAGKAGNDRLKVRNGSSDNSVAGIWNTYRWYYQNANSYEYITGSQTNLTMYFKYGSYDKLTARSLGDRFARAIKNATGYDVTAEVYSYTFCDLKDSWNNSTPEAYMFFTLRYDGDMYIIWIKTCIIKDGGYSDALDGTSADPDYTYPNSSTWSSPGYEISDSYTAESASVYVAAHSNHENKIVRTPYGTFAVHHISGDTDNGNHTGGGRSGLFRIYDDGSYKQIYDFAVTCHTTKPQIMYGDDGLVYFVQPDDDYDYEGSGNISLGYFDPSQPNSDGTYNITYSRTPRNYPGGECPGGYGYSCAYMDYKTGKIYCFYCGGRDDPGFYLCWMTYNYRTHSWVGGARTVFNDYYRQCYLYAFSDEAGGIYLVAERACLLECLGLQGIVYGANYTWDEIALFHITNMTNGSASSQLVIPGDYTQIDRELFPNCHNASSDCYMTSDRKLHVIWQVEMHGRYHHDTKYNALWHCVYDCATPGQDPVLITKAPIQFIASDNFYTMRFVENTSGQIFLLAMPNSRDARCEIWRATNALCTEFQLVACKNFSDTESPTTGMLVPNTRTHSIYDNTIPVLYPISRDPSVVYKSFIVKLPAN